VTQFLLMSFKEKADDDPICPKTGAPMYRGVRPLTVAYKDESVTFDMPGWYCDASDESVHTGADMKFSDRMLNRLEARAEGLLPPDEIRRIRKKLGLPQEQAGELIGAGPGAFQKYETGDLLPSRAILAARSRCSITTPRPWTSSEDAADHRPRRPIIRRNCDRFRLSWRAR
jgi:HTH-type transcriptional regulator / antitoxin MqsA